MHATRLKDGLLSVLPDLREHESCRDTLTFEEDVGSALRKYVNYDSECIWHMLQVFGVRCSFQSSHFDGLFRDHCQQKAVPTSLLALVNMILDGANIKHLQLPSQCRNFWYSTV